MKINKKIEKWAIALHEELDTLLKHIESLETKKEQLHKVWKDYMNNRQGDTNPYGLFSKCKRELEKAIHRKERVELYISAINGESQLYANEIMYSDINPYEVIEMKSEKCWVIRSMKATIKDEAKKQLAESFVPGGFVGHFDNDLQDWDIKPDTDGVIRVIRLHDSKSSRGWFDGRQRFSISRKPCKFYDYNF